jgi:hypothetical protein
MCPATNCDTASVLVFNLLTPFDHLPEITETTCAVGVREDNVLPSNVPHAVGNSPTFPTILLQRNDADATMWYVC